MKVIARKGLRVPMETGRRRYVTDATGVDVPNTVYYRRRIIDGDLITDAAQIAKQEADAKASGSAAAVAKPATGKPVAQATGAANGSDALVTDPSDAASDKTTAKGA